MSVTFEEKLHFLSNAGSYGHPGEEVEVIETHMSFVFLVGDKAYKLKKPVRSAFFDFSTVETRRRNCEAEVTLNRRLAPSMYRGLAAVVELPDGTLAIDQKGAAVDWLVVMLRLPKEDMLDVMLRSGRVPDSGDIGRLAQVLAEFYRRAEHPPIDPDEYVGKLIAEQALNRSVLTSRPFSFDPALLSKVLDDLEQLLVDARQLVAERAAQGALVDGHGDLKPDHICFQNGIVIFDCLEFSRELRTIDPVDELAYLGIECTLLGFPQVGRALAKDILARLDDSPDKTLIHLHGARRSVLRARMSVAHLLEDTPRTPRKWAPLAQHYLLLAQAEMTMAEAAGVSGEP